MIEQSKAKRFSFCSQRNAGRQRGDYIKSQLFLFMRKRSDKDWISKRAIVCREYHPGNSFKTQCIRSA